VGGSNWARPSQIFILAAEKNRTKAAFLENTDMDRLEEFFTTLKSAPERLLFLDYDGTLAPFRRERDRAFPYPGVREALLALQKAAHTRIVVISGRPVAEVRRLLGLGGSLEIWGGHGWERQLPGGQVVTEALPPAAQQALAEAWQWVVGADLTERTERKTASLAVHWRGLAPPEAKKIEATVRKGWRPWLEAGSLELLEFAAGLELRAGGRDKGLVVRSVLAEMESGCVSAFLGDDTTDEDAFLAIRGRGIGVLVSPVWRPTAAEVWLQPPTELLAFFSRWAALAG
jgi:trehalose-phosphatase